MAKTTDLPALHWDAAREAVRLGLMPAAVTSAEHVHRGRLVGELIKFVLDAAREANIVASPGKLDIDAPTLAVLFHNTYGRLAPSHGYETRQETRKFDPDSPNGKLMVATCAAILQELAEGADHADDG
jgi:hypothetical protein